MIIPAKINFSRFSKYVNSGQGFTLVELAVVVSIMLLLFTVGGISLNSYRRLLEFESTL